jgi:hypothetical protein
MDAYCVDSVSVWLLEVELTKKKCPQAKTSKRAFHHLGNENFSGI